MSHTSVCKRVMVAFPKIDNVAEWSNILAVRDRYDPLAVSIAPHLHLGVPFRGPCFRPGAAPACPRGRVHYPEFWRHSVRDHGAPRTVRLPQRESGETTSSSICMTSSIPVRWPRTTCACTRLYPTLRSDVFRQVTITAALDAHVWLYQPHSPAYIAAVSVYRIEPDGSRPVLFEIALQPVGGV